MDNSGSMVGGGYHQPKARGRPRASFAQTGEFDLSLIREYSSRPSLYDRNSKRFKDKMFTAQQWQIISHKLGYDVSLLKDRMLQLRNRYNIEKRRLEQLREDANDETVESPWPLFGSMSFLSDHIRSRRSYKNISKPEQSGGEMDNSDENDEADTSSGIMPDVKVEMESETDIDIDAEQQLPAAAVLKLPTNNNNLNLSSTPSKVLRVHSTRIAERMSAAAAAAAAANAKREMLPISMMPSSITIRRVDGKHSIAEMSSSKQNQQQSQHQQQHQPIHSPQPRAVDNNICTSSTGSNAVTYHSSNNNNNNNNNNNSSSNNILHQRNRGLRVSNGSNQSLSAIDDDDLSGNNLGPIPKRQCFGSSAQQSPQRLPSATLVYNKPADKYRAFGDFVGSSLADLPAHSALMLIEKFTTELVNTMKQQFNNTDENSTTDVATATKTGTAATGVVGVATAEAAAAATTTSGTTKTGVSPTGAAATCSLTGFVQANGIDNGVGVVAAGGGGGLGGGASVSNQ